MAHARYLRTLILPPMYGQYKLWLNEITKFIQNMDEIISLGNMIGLTDLVKDKTETKGANNFMLKSMTLYRATHTDWIQIVGPNEILALNFPDKWTNNSSVKLLRANWLENEIGNTFRVASVNRERLVTHGGLTYGMWVEIGKPETPQEAADRLNEKFYGNLYMGECFSMGNRVNYAANPVFADPVMEVYPSWLTAPELMPFSQLHGAMGLNSRDGSTALNEEHSPLQYIEQLSKTNYGSRLIMPGGSFFVNVSVDLQTIDYAKYLPRPWRFYIEKTPVLDLRDDLFKPTVKDTVT